jgi:toxin ParE1/3/4
MRLEFHPLAMRELLDAQIYYKEINLNLGYDFRREVTETVQIIQNSPAHYHPVSSKSRFRRANLKRFPYHLVYETIDSSDLIRVLVVRHDRRHPSFGLNRRWN